MAVVNLTYPKLIYISDIKDFIVYYKTKDNIIYGDFSKMKDFENINLLFEDFKKAMEEKTSVTINFNQNQIKIRDKIWKVNFFEKKFERVATDEID